MTPDGTGKYLQTGTYGGKPYYRREDGAYFIWWKAPADWFISVGIEDVAAGSWKLTDPDVDGVYDPIAEYLGIATVAEI